MNKQYLVENTQPDYFDNSTLKRLSDMRPKDVQEKMFTWNLIREGLRLKEFGNFGF